MKRKLYKLDSIETDNINHVGEYLRDKYFLSTERGLSKELNPTYNFKERALEENTLRELSASFNNKNTIKSFYSESESVRISWSWKPQCVMIIQTPEFSIINSNCSKANWKTYFNSSSISFDNLRSYLENDRLNVIPPLPSIPESLIHNPPLSKDDWLDNHLIILEGWKPLMKTYSELFDLFPSSKAIKTIYAITPQTYELTSVPTLLYKEHQIFYNSWFPDPWYLMTTKQLDKELSNDYKYFSGNYGYIYKFEELEDLNKVI